MTTRSHNIMPKQTFFNLPDEKRENIINIAVDEFAEFGLENASTNRIVLKSGISKGSFYQYFEDKQDIFMHLLKILEREKMAYLSGQSPPNMNLDTFAYYRWMVKTGLAFNSTNPKMVQAVTRVMVGERFFFSKYLADARERTKEFIKNMINNAIEKGEIDPSIDVDLAVMVMEAWQNTITTYILDEGMKKKDFAAWIYSAKTQEMIDKLLYVMEYGLRKTESEFITHPPSNSPFMGEK